MSVQQALGGVMNTAFATALGASHVYQQSPHYKYRVATRQADQLFKLAEKTDFEYPEIYEASREKELEAVSYRPTEEGLKRKSEIESERAEEDYYEKEKAKFEKIKKAEQKADVEKAKANEQIRKMILMNDDEYRRANATQSYQDILNKVKRGESIYDE